MAPARLASPAMSLLRTAQKLALWRTVLIEPLRLLAITAQDANVDVRITGPAPRRVEDLQRIALHVQRISIQRATNVFLVTVWTMACASSYARMWIATTTLPK